MLSAVWCWKGHEGNILATRETRHGKSGLLDPVRRNGIGSGCPTRSGRKRVIEISHTLHPLIAVRVGARELDPYED